MDYSVSLLRGLQLWHKKSGGFFSSKGNGTYTFSWERDGLERRITVNQVKSTVHVFAEVVGSEQYHPLSYWASHNDLIDAMDLAKAYLQSPATPAKPL